jgi:hypothetical protein
MVPVVTVTSYFSNQKQLAHGQFEKEIDHTELSSHRRAPIMARLFGFVDPDDWNRGSAGRAQEPSAVIKRLDDRYSPRVFGG